MTDNDNRNISELLPKTGGPALADKIAFDDMTGEKDPITGKPVTRNATLQEVKDLIGGGGGTGSGYTLVDGSSNDPDDYADAELGTTVFVEEGAVGDFEGHEGEVALAESSEEQPTGQSTGQSLIVTDPA